MTLLIAWFLIYGFNFNPIWYVISFVVWFVHFLIINHVRVGELIKRDQVNMDHLLNDLLKTAKSLSALLKSENKQEN